MKKIWLAFNWKLWGAIFLTLLVPVVYRTLRIFFIGTLPDANSFSIASNLQWINVLFEVLEEAFLLPLFFTLKHIIEEKELELRNRKIVWQILIISLIYLLCIIIFLSLTNQFLSLVSVQNNIQEVTKFVQVEFCNRFFIMLGKIGIIFLIAKNLYKPLIVLLCLETILNCLLDLFIVSSYSCSLQKGVLWIAYDQLIITSFMAIIYLFYITYSYKFKLSHFKPKIYFHRQSWLQYFYSGLESFTRNAFFIWFVIRTINKLDAQYNQGDFWVANSFIYDWLLLPILTLSQFLNREQALASKEKSLRIRLIVPLIIVAITIICWLILIPAYEPFARVVLNHPNSKLVSHLVLISLGFYILFAINDPIDKIMFGDGKAYLVLIQSLIINIVVYIPYFLITKTMTIDDVAIMMGLAIALDSLITLIIFWWKYKNQLVKKKTKVQSN